MISYGRQSISQEDIDDVVKTLQSDFLTQGPKIHEFESKFANYVGSKFAVAVSSSTAGLHLSCLALGLTENKLAWTVPNTFVATSNSVLYTGAMIDFVDIDLQTYNLSIEFLEKKLYSAKVKPDVIIPVHFSGCSCDMKEIYRLSEKYNFQILEDASHAVGSSFNQRKVGACEFSNLCVFSFHPVKIITTGEGGMVTTNDESLYQKLIRLRSHGIIREEGFLQNTSHGGWYYEQIDLGLNYRITDIQASLGISQLKRLDSFVQRRNEIAKLYSEALAGLPIQLPLIDQENQSSFHLYVIRTNRRKELYDFLKTKNIFTQVHYIPVHTQPFYQKLGFQLGDFPISEKYYEEALTLPIHFNLSDKDLQFIINSIKEFFEE